MNVKLSKRELATVLASLRRFQENPNPNMIHFEDAKPLSSEEIDDLCERINVS